MEENRLGDEDLEDDDGMILSEDDILQVIELGDNQPINGNAFLIVYVPCCSCMLRVSDYEILRHHDSRIIILRTITIPI